MCSCEKAGIPGCVIGFADQVSYARNIALNNGVPNIRWIDTPRTGTGPEAVAVFFDDVEEALTAPLTAKEKEEGLYSPPAPPRVIFEGTLHEAQDFLQQTVIVENCRNCPIAKYTDGLPVIIPTEEKVAEMLTGTSHSSSEVIATQHDSMGWGGVQEKGRQISYAQQFTYTVEKVAVCAVMAGCKPEFLPVALAAATAGGQTTHCPGTSSNAGYMWVVSGPIAKEIGMNAGQNAYDVGNHANMTIGRVGALISINAGGCITGVTRTDAGNIINSVCFAEDMEGLPAGWEGFNEEAVYYDMDTEENVNYTANDSVLGKLGTRGCMVHTMHSPGSTRALQSGIGGFARYVLAEMGQPELENPPGTDEFVPLNPLMGWTYTVSKMDQSGGKTFLVDKNVAQFIKNAGFNKKAEVYEWLYNTYFITLAEYRNMGWFSFATNEGNNPESTTGKPYNELPPDFKIHAYGRAPDNNCLLVANGFADENVYTVLGGRPSAYPIDPWR